MPFMFETNESPFLRLEFAQINAIGSNLRLSILWPDYSVVDFVINKVRLHSTSLRCIEGEKYRQRGLNTRFNVF